MPQPTTTSPLSNPSHSMLHNERLNVKAFGAVGDGVADDTAEIQAAMDAAFVAGGGGEVFFPPGSYKITSTLIIDSDASSLRLSGSNGANPNASIGSDDFGTRIFGDFNAPLLQRTAPNPTGASVVIEDIGFENDHTTGTGLSLVGLQVPSGIYRCSIRANKAITIPDNSFEYEITNCFLQRPGGTYAGSIGIFSVGHANIRNVDLSGFERGIDIRGPASHISGGRIETCGTGAYLGGAGNLFKGTIADINFEACDTAIRVQEAGPAIISGHQISGTAGSPSGGSIYGIDINIRQGVTIIGCSGGGLSTAFINVPAAAIKENLTIISCVGSPWTVTDTTKLEIIHCAGFDAVISPPQLTANQNDWAPTGVTTAKGIRVSSDASRDITGILALIDNGNPLFITNVGTNNVVLKHNVTSNASFRFFCPGSVDFTLTPGLTALLFYDTTSAKWRVM